MAFYDKFPYTNFQEINLDQIIKTVKQLEADWKSWYPTHEFKFADPIEWSGNNFYDIYTIVLGPDGNTYLSKQPVPPGVSVLNTDYWQKINDASAQIDAVNDRIDGVVEDLDEVAERYPRRTYYRPEQFGAVVNDSTVDSGPAIQSAIDAAYDNNGIVLLSEGTYYMDTPVLITSHPIGLYIIGTGAFGREVNRGSGTRLWYRGNGAAIHFSNGLQNSTLQDFTIYNSVAGTCLKLSAENDPAPGQIARTTMCNLINMRFLYQETGVYVNNAAYFRLKNCDFAAQNVNIANRCGINIAAGTVNNEYVFLENCVVDNYDVTAYGSTPAGRAVNVEKVSHLFFQNLDVTDSDYGIYFDESVEEVNFVYADTIDLARVRYGIYAKLNSHALNNVIIEQLIYTAPLDVGANDRVIFVEKVAGGGAYNARIKINAITLRTGDAVMDYWIDCSSVPGNDAFGPGFCEFKFTNSAFPKVNYGTQRQTNDDFSTHGMLPWTSGVDCNDVKQAGLYPQTLTSSATNGPGFACFLLVFASVRYSTQIAISTSSIAALAVRVYDADSDTWTAWRQIAGTV